MGFNSDSLKQIKALETILVSQYENIRVITLNSPPLNVLSTVTRSALWDEIKQASSDPSVQAILLMAGNKNFCGGADIKEFGKTTSPRLIDIAYDIESTDKLVVSAIRGFCLGGGLELALATHYRIAEKGSRIALPEVKLGILPGGGGTQRASRVMGAKNSLQMMLTGDQLSAEQALELGLLDKVVEAKELEKEAITWAESLLASNAPIRRSRDAQALADKEKARAEVEEAKIKIQKQKGLLSPINIIKAVEAAIELPYEQSQLRERELFDECLNSPQRKALIHAFFSEKKSNKIPEVAEPLSLNTIGVIGAGTMGTGIAQALMKSNIKVILLERDDESLSRGINTINKSLDSQVSRGRINEEQKQNQLANLVGSTDFSLLKDADMVIEAVFEDMEVKKTLFTQLNSICGQDTILASNTSYLDINEIAKSVDNPSRVIGVHFFSPANIMKLVEVVVTDTSSDQTVATAFALAKQLNKIPVRSGVCDGFIGNRVLAIYREAIELAMLDGASPYQIDEAIREFGYPMGPFQMSDMAGGDIGWATRKRRAPFRNPKLRTIPIADRICEQGWFGQKTGKGYYIYEQGSRVGIKNPDVEAIIDKVRAERGITPKTFTNQDLIDRYMAAMVNEAAHILHEKIALRPSDIDVIQINGYGFPRYKGGPMFYADSVGLDKILANIEQYAKDDPEFWKPSPLLVKLVQEKANFASLND